MSIKKNNFRKKFVKLVKNNPSTFITIILWIIISIKYIYENKWEIPIILFLVGIMLGYVYGGLFRILYFFKNKK